MNTPARSPLEGQPPASGGQVAELPSPAPAVGAPKESPKASEVLLVPTRTVTTGAAPSHG